MSEDDYENCIAALDANKIESEIFECESEINRLEADFREACSVQVQSVEAVNSSAATMERCESELEILRARLENLRVDLMYAGSEAA